MTDELKSNNVRRLEDDLLGHAEASMRKLIGETRDEVVTRFAVADVDSDDGFVDAAVERQCIGFRVFWAISKVEQSEERRG